MDPGLFRYDERTLTDGRAAARTIFAWTVAILLLTGTRYRGLDWKLLHHWSTGTAGELPDLQKLHKVDPPKRFELTAAPAGEFLTAQQVFERYSAMGAAELAKVNGELVRNYIVIFNRCAFGS